MEVNEKKSIKVSDMPQEYRPRERLRAQSATSLTNEELLAILLRVGTKQESVIALATRILSIFGSLKDLSYASLNELEKIHGIGAVKAVELKAFLELSSRLHNELTYRTVTKITKADDVAHFLAPKFYQKEQEEFWLLALNTKNHIIGSYMITKGLVDRSLVHPREIFKAAIRFGAVKIVVAHNHPSGDLIPSKADFAVTKHIYQCGQLLQIPLLDHVIVANPLKKSQDKVVEYYSFADEGELD